jgi:hypothetical protein
MQLDLRFVARLNAVVTKSATVRTLMLGVLACLVATLVLQMDVSIAQTYQRSSLPGLQLRRGPSIGHASVLRRVRALAPRAGFEPATIRLTVECSTAELPRNRRKQSFASRQRITKPSGLAKDQISRFSAALGESGNLLRHNDLLSFRRGGTGHRRRVGPFPPSLDRMDQPPNRPIRRRPLVVPHSNR